jgi:hypothetical protein
MICGRTLHKLLLTFTICALLSGCSSIRKEMIGQFDAQNGDFMIIKRDGAVLWSPPSKTTDRLSFVGIAAPEKEEPLVVPLIVPSASPFLYAKLTFSADFSHVAMDWGKVLDGKARDRATNYVRRK